MSLHALSITLFSLPLTIYSTQRLYLKISHIIASWPVLLTGDIILWQVKLTWPLEKASRDAIMDHEALSAASDSVLWIKKSIPEAQAAHSLVAKTNELAGFTAHDSEGS